MKNVEKEQEARERLNAEKRQGDSWYQCEKEQERVSVKT